MEKETTSRQDVPSGESGTGYLIVRVTTARGAIPLEGAQVNIRNTTREPISSRGDVIASLTTDRDGNTARISLPAPSGANSMKPNGGTPYTPYHLDVYSEGYYAQNYYNLPIFDGITAIQPVDMIPLPENGRTDSHTYDGERYFESTAPQL